MAFGPTLRLEFHQLLQLSPLILELKRFSFITHSYLDFRTQSSGRKLKSTTNLWEFGISLMLRVNNIHRFSVVGLTKTGLLLHDPVILKEYDTFIEFLNGLINTGDVMFTISCVVFSCI